MKQSYFGKLLLLVLTLAVMAGCTKKLDLKPVPWLKKPPDPPAKKP